MTQDSIFVLILLALVVVLFATEKIRLDVIAILVVVCLSLSGVLTISQSLQGFANPVVIMIAALFVISEALRRSGVASVAGDQILALGGQSQTKITLLIMWVVAILSSFMSSTGAVAIFIPIVTMLCAKANLDRRQMLMPVAIAALIGGMITLITPPNLIANSELISANEAKIGFFEFGYVGLAMLIVVSLFMLLFGQKLIKASDTQFHETAKDKGVEDLVSRFAISAPMYQLVVGKNNQWVGHTIRDLQARRKYGFMVVAVAHVGRTYTHVEPAYSSTTIRVGDVLCVIAEDDDFLELIKGYDTVAKQVSEQLRHQVESVVGLAETLIAPESPLIGRTIRQAQFRSLYKLGVIAVLRGREKIIHRPLDLELQAHDRLLLIGDWNKIQNLSAYSDELIMLTIPREHKHAIAAGDRLYHALAILVLMIASLTFGWLPAPITIVCAAMLMGWAGCINMTQAYKAINWPTIVLIAGMLPMSTAMQVSGAMSLLVDTISILLAESSIHWVLATLFVITSLLSQFVSNTATTVLIAPIAISLGQALGIDPKPLVMTVAIAASSAFATPVASPVNALVMAPGGYKFFDFVKVGLPLQLISLVITLTVLPFLYF